jgi:hypothetical protein
MVSNLKELKELMEATKKMQDWYFLKYQRFGDKQYHDHYLEYRGQEIGIQTVLDILGIDL